MDFKFSLTSQQAPIGWAVKHYYKGCISFNKPLRTSVVPPALLPTLARAPSPSSTTQEILVLARPRENPALRANQTPLQEGKKSQAKFYTMSLLSSFRLEPGVVWNNYRNTYL